MFLLLLFILKPAVAKESNNGNYQMTLRRRDGIQQIATFLMEEMTQMFLFVSRFFLLARL